MSCTDFAYQNVTKITINVVRSHIAFAHMHLPLISDLNNEKKIES